MNKYIQQKQENFIKIIDFFISEISKLRTGRANAAILDSVLVNAYGSNSSLNTLASITVQDASSMVVATWDKSVLKNAEKGIIDANLGVGVVNEGEKLRISIPQMTEENRRELVKQLNEKYEAGRISIRQIRDEVKNNIENAEKIKEISEDDKFRLLKELEEYIYEQSKELKKIRDNKEKDVMTI